MSTPGELVRALASVLGIPEATVTVHDRNLVTAGLRSMHGRGRGAAKVTAADAANLLTAVLGSSQVKESAETVDRFGRTRAVRSTPKGYRIAGVPALAQLGAEHSFTDVLEALFLSAADETCQMPASIEIVAINPAAIGEIRLAALPDRSVVHIRYARPRPWPKGATPSPKQEAAWRSAMTGAGDLQQCRRVTGRTIMDIAQTLSRA